MIAAKASFAPMLFRGPFVDQPITEQQYNTRYFQLLQILSINKVTLGSDMLLFPTSCNPNYNIAHQFSLVIYCHWIFNNNSYVL